MNIYPLHEKWADSLVDLWNEEYARSFPMRNILFKQNSITDRNIHWESSFVAVSENGDPIGFIISKVWKEEMDLFKNRGWINSLVVKKDYRLKGLGTELFRSAEKKLMEAGIKTVFLGRDPWHYFPGIPDEDEGAKRWAVKQGFVSKGKDFDMYRHIPDGEATDHPALEGYEFMTLRQEEQEQLLEFLHASFPGRWEYETVEYFKRGGMGREFVVAKKNNKIVGFCRVNDSQSPFIAQNVYWAPLFSDHELGGIGPLGIDSKERKKGLGLEIVKAGIRTLQERGNQSIVIDWTGITDFYKKLGFDIWKSYEAYSKQL